MNDKYHISIEYGKTWRAKCKAIKSIYGDWDESYNLLPRFLDAIKEANLANEFILISILYTLISVDGTHLYGKYPHCLLIATTLDGNNDRQKGLIRVVERQFLPLECFHRFCVRHLVANFKKTFKNETLIALIWYAGRKTNIIDFDHTLELIEQQTHDDNVRFGVLTTNMSKSFNNVRRGARRLPILALVMDTTRACRVHLYTNNMHEITMDDEKLYQVDLANMTCTCTHFQMEQNPCTHTIAVCAKINYYFNQLCSPWYTTEAYRGKYAIGFYLPKDKLYWPNTDVRVVPPIARKQPGHLRSVHIHTKMDKGERGTYVCGTCKQSGRNSRKCRNPPVNSKHVIEGVVNLT
ncbi:uncharacterized protein [Aristolochia californica]|uniref:uncharacterized protein n=1 Tax=Aristolochia californica TaxID=171875 RepID=UPI0035D6E196